MRTASHTRLHGRVSVGLLAQLAARLAARLAACLAACLAALLATLLVLPGCGSPKEPFRFTGEGGLAMPMEVVSDVPLVMVTVEEGSPRSFLVDTGSPATLLSPGPFALTEGLYQPDTVSFLGITVLEPTLGVLELFGGALPLAGILGGDLLRHFALTLDYREAMAVLWVGLGGAMPSYGTGFANEVGVPFALLGGGIIALPSGARLSVPATRVTIAMELEDMEITAVVDTGASTLVLDEDLFDILIAAHPERPRLLGLEVITMGGVTPAEVSRVSRLALADAPDGTELPSVPLMVLRRSPLFWGLSEEVGRPVEALLGGSYLRAFQVTLDYPARRLSLRRYSTRPHVDPREWISVGFTWRQSPSGQVLVETLFEDTDAVTQGLSPGDRILAAGGRDVTFWGASAVSAAVDASELGDRVPFTLEHSGVPYEATVLIEDLLPTFQ